MSYRCPLCLAELNESQQLMLYCSAHKAATDPFVCDAARLDSLRCPTRGRCGSHQLVVWHHGLFAKHITCEAKFNFAHFKTDGCVAKFRVKDKLEPVEHWEIEMLRDLADPGPTGLNRGDEMWFPAALLRATEASADNSVSSASVELCGAIRSGKTVIAMQALDLDSYHPSPRVPKYTVNDYIYLLPEGDDLSTSAFFDTLQMRGLMQANQLTTRPHSRTNPAPMNLKAVFLRPLPSRSRPERPAGFWARMVEDVRGLFTMWAQPRPNSHTVIFYDTAGELTQSPADSYLARLDTVLGTVAVVIDARDVWGPEGRSRTKDYALATGNTAVGGSLQPACHRLQRIGEQRGDSDPLLPRCCLVVTKADIAAISAESMAQLTKLADSDRTEDREERKRVFRSSLEGISLNSPDRANVEQLLGLLDRNVDEVFFVWTPNPPGETGPSVQPRTHGLAAFVCWCLKRPIDQVVPMALRRTGSRTGP